MGTATAVGEFKTEPRAVAVQQSALRIAFASGGSGGHLYPGMAIAQAMEEMFPAINPLFLVSEKAVEAKILSQTRYAFQIIASCPPNMHNAGMFVSKLWQGYKRSLSIFRQFDPQALVALGGFSCLAPALAARTLGIPIFVQEQNCLAGRANLLLSLLAKGVFAPFAGMEKQFPASRVMLTGNPVRRSAFAIEREAAVRELGLERDRFTILVLGGSQGAHFLNDLVAQSLCRLADLKKELQWIHLTGAQHAETLRMTYVAGGWKAAVFPFFERMGLCYGAADLVVSRAGASTIAEIIANGMASVLVPLPEAMRDHQTKNAELLSKRNAAYLLDQRQLTPSSFSTVLKSLLRDSGRLERMRLAAKKMYAGDAAQSISRELFRRVAR